MNFTWNFGGEEDEPQRDKPASPGYEATMPPAAAVSAQEANGAELAPARKPIPREAIIRISARLTEYVLTAKGM